MSNNKTAIASGFFVFYEGVLRRDDVDNLFLNNTAVKVGLAAATEGNLADNHGIEGVVMANLYVLSGLNLGTALAHNNHARTSCLAIRKLNPEELRV